MSSPPHAARPRDRDSVARPLRRRLRAHGAWLVVAAVLAALAQLAGSSRAHAQDTRTLAPVARSASAAPAPRPGEAAEEATEHGLKAEFLARFAVRYVKWPETAFADKTAPFVVAVVGKDPFGKELEKAFAGKQVGDHPIKLVRHASVDELEPCHLLFVPAAQEKHLKRIREACEKRSTLVVAESIAAAQAGAHVGFYLEKARVRFAINPAEAKQAKLEISSELLKLAKLVETKPGSGR